MSRCPRQCHNFKQNSNGNWHSSCFASLTIGIILEFFISPLCSLYKCVFIFVFDGNNLYFHHHVSLCIMVIWIPLLFCFECFFESSAHFSLWLPVFVFFFLLNNSTSLLFKIFGHVYVGNILWFPLSLGFWCFWWLKLIMDFNIMLTYLPFPF